MSDNGPGIPPAVVSSVLDFSVRVSSREAYVAPDRGRQGNALKTIVGIPFVLSGEKGQLCIEARGVRHEITLGIDRLRQRPVVDHQQTPTNLVPGTSIFVAWPDSPRLIVSDENSRFLQNEPSDAAVSRHSPRSILWEAKDRFLQLVADYAWLNPHLSLRLNWHGEQICFDASDAQWSKWRPWYPTDPHWYRTEDLERLLAAHIVNAAAPERSLREFVSEFRGLASTGKVKKLLASLGLTRAKLTDFVQDDAIDGTRLAELLAAMKAATRPVKSDALGTIGREHLASRCAEAGAQMESFQYKRVLAGPGELPWVLEVAFAWCPEATQRRIVTGVNWSPAILNPFRQLGMGGKSLDAILEEQRVGQDEPTIVFLHLACPRVNYADRGKSSVIIED